MYVHNPNLIVISGGPGSGKTTLLNALSRSGFEVAAEVARQIIKEEVESGGVAVPWGDQRKFTYSMLQRSIEVFEARTPTATPVFFDRGIPDCLCYARLVGLSDTREIEAACRRYGYAKLVFLAPPWLEIYETDTERKQDFAEAERTYTLMAEVYREFGYDLIDLPKTSPSARAQFILDCLHLKP